MTIKEKLHSPTRVCRRVAGLLLQCSLVLMIFLLAEAKAQQCELHKKTSDAPLNTLAAEAAAKLSGLTLYNQKGERIDFYEDLVKDKIVVINFIYTSCTAVCPLQGLHFARVQALLGTQLGREVSLISISTDPENDTPERLMSWGKRYKVRDGWTLVTGRKDQIDLLMVALTGAVARRGEHSSIVYFGNSRTGKWVREFGLMPPEELVQLVRQEATANIDINVRTAAPQTQPSLAPSISSAR